MLRTFLAIAAALLALPALLAAQQPGTPRAGAVHGKATQFLGEVVRPSDATRTVAGVENHQTHGDKVEDQKEGPEGPDVEENHDGHEGHDVDVDEGPDGHEGPDVEEGPKGNAQSQGDGDEENGPDNPPPAPGRNRIGRHRP